MSPFETKRAPKTKTQAKRVNGKSNDEPVAFSHLCYALALALTGVEDVGEQSGVPMWLTNALLSGKVVVSSGSKSLALHLDVRSPQFSDLVSFLAERTVSRHQRR